MSGRKHHFIQQLLLKGFSYDRPRNPCHIWVYRQGSKPFKTATEGYGAERDYYGKPGESDLDARISVLESKKYSLLINDLRASGPRCVDAGAVSDFAIHVISRAQNLSGQMVEGLNAMRPHMESILSNEMELKRLLLSKLVAHPVAAFVAQQTQAGVLGPNQSLEKFVERFISEHKATLLSLVKQNLDGMDDFVAKAHRNTLEARLEDRTGGRFDQLSSLSWRVADSDKKLILGDSVMFTELDDGNFKPMTEPADPLKAVWLPLSSTRVLIGYQSGRQVEVDATRLNQGAASCSFMAFCAEDGPDMHQGLHKLIRSATFRLDASAAETSVKSAFVHSMSG